MEALLKEDRLPVPERTLPPISLDVESMMYAEEEPFCPIIQKISQEVFMLALQVGQLARDLRAEARSRQYDIQNVSMHDSLFVMDRQTRIQNLHRTLDHSQASWQIRFPEYWTWLGNLDSLPHRVFAWTQHVCLPLHNMNHYTDINDSHTCSFAPVLFTLILACSPDSYASRRQILSTI